MRFWYPVAEMSHTHINRRIKSTAYFYKHDYLPGLIGMKTEYNIGNYSHD